MFLTLPAAEDRTLASLHRKVRLLGLRAILSASPPSPSAARLQRSLRGGLETDGPATLARIGAPDVLPRALCLAAGVLPPSVCFEGLAERLEAGVPTT